jgi:hypothetical protein
MSKSNTPSFVSYLFPEEDIPLTLITTSILNGGSGRRSLLKFNHSLIDEGTIVTSAKARLQTLEKVGGRLVKSGLRIPALVGELVVDPFVPVPPVVPPPKADSAGPRIVESGTVVEGG